MEAFSEVISEGILRRYLHVGLGVSSFIERCTWRSYFLKSLPSFLVRPAFAEVTALVYSRTPKLLYGTTRPTWRVFVFWVFVSYETLGGVDRIIVEEFHVSGIIVLRLPLPPPRPAKFNFNPLPRAPVPFLPTGVANLMPLPLWTLWPFQPAFAAKASRIVLKIILANIFTRHYTKISTINWKMYQTPSSVHGNSLVFTLIQTVDFNSPSFISWCENFSPFVQYL